MKAKIYNVYDYGERIGSWSSKDAETLIGVPRNRVPIYATRGQKYNKRYTFEAEEPRLDFAEEWNNACERITGKKREVS